MLPQHGTLEISRSRLRHNLAFLQKQTAPHAALCPVIKANAYGHGADLIAACLQEEGIQWAAVYNLQEAASLTHESNLKILTLAPVVITDSQSPILHHLGESSDTPIRLNITDLHTAQILSKSVPPQARPWPIHVQIDTGLTRAGVSPQDAPQLLQQIASLPNLLLEGLFTHFSHGDVPGHPTLRHQLQQLLAIAEPLKKHLPNLLLHAQNSGGIHHIANPALNLARIGIALYGLQPSTAHPIPNLQPIARVTAPILAIHDRPANTGVGYGHTFTTTKFSRIAIVPVGYADGYPRRLSNNSIAHIHNQSAPLVVRVSMDQITLDITHLPSAKIGDTVIVISHNPQDPNSLDKMADTLGTIGYELATHLGPRLTRTIVD